MKIAHYISGYNLSVFPFVKYAHALASFLFKYHKLNVGF